MATTFTKSKVKINIEGGFTVFIYKGKFDPNKNPHIVEVRDKDRSVCMERAKHIFHLMNEYPYGL